MAIKFAANDIFRWDLSKLIEGKNSSLKAEEEVELNLIIGELKKLACDDVVHNADERFIGPNVDIRIDTVFLERSMDPEKSADLIFQAHQVLKTHFIPTSLYRSMEQALKELGVKDLNPDLEVAIKDSYSRNYGIGISGWDDLGYFRQFRPQNSIDKSRKGGPERL